MPSKIYKEGLLTPGQHPRIQLIIQRHLLPPHKPEQPTSQEGLSNAAIPVPSHLIHHPQLCSSLPLSLSRSSPSSSHSFSITEQKAHALSPLLDIPSSPPTRIQPPSIAPHRPNSRHALISLPLRASAHYSSPTSPPWPPLPRPLPRKDGGSHRTQTSYPCAKVTPLPPLSRHHRPRHPFSQL